MLKKQVPQILFGGAFFAVLSITIGLTRVNNGLALIWLGAGVGASWLLATPREHWARTLLTMGVLSMIATTFFGFGPRPAFPLALANTLEIWLIAHLLLVAREERDWLDSVGGLAVFIAIGGVVAPALAAVLGAGSVTLIVGGSFGDHAISWLIAHGLGTVIVFPVVQAIVGWTNAGTGSRPSKVSAAEFAGHVVAVSACAWIAIHQSGLPLLFVPIVPALFAAFRCGRAGAALSTIIIGAVAGIAFQANASIVNGLALTYGQKILFLQFYLAVISLLAIPTSVALRQHRLLLRQLEYGKALKRLIAEHCDDVLVNLDEDGRIRFASPSGETLTGHSDLVGEHLSVFFDPLDEAEIRGAIDQAAANPGMTVVMERPVLRGGDELWLEAKLRTAHAEGTGFELRGFAVTIRDVTARKHGELEALHAAETDPLTQLPNRRVLLRQIERAIATAGDRPAALAIVDLDHFKGINDTHGHVVGDTVLRQVANVMRRYTGPTRMFARLGGEEFALLDTGADFAASEALCEELRAAIARIMPRGADGRRFLATASIGIAPVAPGQAVPAALQAADDLLYRAKSAGRNRVMAPALPASDSARRVA